MRSIMPVTRGEMITAHLSNMKLHSKRPWNIDLDLRLFDAWKKQMVVFHGDESRKIRKNIKQIQDKLSLRIHTPP